MRDRVAHALTKGLISVRKTAFQQLMWGILFVFFTFRIQGVDVLPDVIGFVLFLVGLSPLAKEHPSFRIAHSLCIPLLILSLFQIYEPPHQPPSGVVVNGNLGHPLFMLLGLVRWVLFIFMIYHVCRAIRELAHDNGLSTLAAMAQSRWTMFVAYQVIVVVTMLLGVVGGVPLAFVLTVVGFVFGLVLLIMFMQLMGQCSQEL